MPFLPTSGGAASREDIGAAECITNMRASQGKKKRTHGTDAVKSHILAARTVANIVRTSLVGSASSIGGYGKAFLLTVVRDLADWTKFLYHLMAISQ